MAFAYAYFLSHFLMHLFVKCIFTTANVGLCSSNTLFWHEPNHLNKRPEFFFASSYLHCNFIKIFLGEPLLLQFSLFFPDLIMRPYLRRTCWTCGTMYCTNSRTSGACSTFAREFFCPYVLEFLSVWLSPRVCKTYHRFLLRNLRCVISIIHMLYLQSNLYLLR